MCDVLVKFRIASLKLPSCQLKAAINFILLPENHFLFYVFYFIFIDRDNAH
uniref:Uncharacterized protein n=1 Tax=Anguilla anguilla TaxID=7936 RepID=A0A0E9QLI9_ANGAN